MTHATLLLLELGEHTEVVQERLGHSTITTSNIHSHVTEERKRTASPRTSVTRPPGLSTYFGT
jgi:site-specific recombinase XerD